MENVVVEGDRVFTVIPEDFDSRSVYGEKITTKDDRKLRVWSPYRSKLAAAILRGIDMDIKSDYQILYLGAAAGTTVSHLSDIAYRGTIYAVEISPFPLRKLLDVCRMRKNIIPIMEDANHPERYLHLVPKVNFLYQDIAQRNQIDIFIKNCNMYLMEDGEGIIMVKSRSIDTTAEPEEVYGRVIDRIEKGGYEIRDVKKLDPHAKDHACIIIKRG